MIDDLRYAVRFLTRRRGFTLVAVVTLALGVGANTAVFSIADAVLFRPLPYAHSDRLFVLELTPLSTGRGYGTMPVEDLQAARATGLFDGVLDLDQVGAAFVREGDRLVPIRVQPVPLEYLAVLGVRPIYGRDFNESDRGQRAVLLTWRSWVRRYGANPAVLDSTIPTVDGAPMHVVGVLPPSFRVASATVFFVPPDVLTMEPPSYPPGSRASTPIARLAAGLTPEAAQARLSAVRGTDIKPGETELRLVPLREVMGRSSGRTLWLLGAAALLVLIVGCANLANLVLARGAERQRELAVRASLGAPRWRLMRLLLVENIAIAVLGGAVGLCLAYWSFGVLVANLPETLARSVDPSFDARTFGFALAAALAVGLLSGLVPAWQLARVDARGLQPGRLQSWSTRAGRRALLSLEVGLAVVAVIAAVLLGRSLEHLITQQLGFDATRLIVSARTIGAGAASQDRAARAAEFVARLEAVRGIPGVRSVGAMTILPASGAAPDSLLFPRGAGRGGVWTVTSGFFRTMGIPVIEGRELDERESFAAAPVGILNQSAARALFPDGHALGRQVTAPNQPARTIVGVVADWRQSLKRAAEPAMYVPFDPARFRSAQLIVDAPDTPVLRERIRQSLTLLSPDSYVTMTPVSALLDGDAAPVRFMLVVIGLFAALTMLLATLGVYGVIAFIARERTREYGVRVALGATRRIIGALVVRQAMVPIAVGLAAGLIAAAWTSRLLTAQLFEVAPADAVTFAGTALLLFASGIAAAAIPARRATRVDPMIALRAE
jgi:putative ABC transport system permease protein